MEVCQSSATGSTSNHRLPKSDRCYIAALANESLTLVAEHLAEDPVTFTGLMLTCRRLAGVCEYVRYTSLSVQGSKGRRLLATLISGTPTVARYCGRVKRAWFKYWHEAEMYIVSALMCEALPLMVNLITLRIDAHTIDVPHALDRMNRTGLIRSGLHPMLSIKAMSTNEIAYSPLTLPSVRNMMISGSYSLSYIANHRSLSELSLESFLDYDDLADFVSIAENTLLGDSLTVLGLKVVRSVDLTMALPIISSAFYHLQRLSIEQAALKFMSVVGAIGTSTTLFPQLRFLVLNRKLTYPLMRWGSSLEGEDSPLTTLSKRIGETCFNHPHLQYVGIGRHLWVRSYEGSFIETKKYNTAVWWSNYIGEQFAPERYPPW